MKYALICLFALSLISCGDKPKPKTSANLKAVEDTSVKVDNRKKTILNHRY